MKPKKTNPRTAARALALQGLFMLDVQGDSGFEAAGQYVADQATEEFPAVGPRGPFRAVFETLVSWDRGKTDTLPARTVAVDVPARTAPTPNLPAGPFRVVWEGDVESPFDNTHVFSAVGRGTMAVEVNGGAVLQGSGFDLSDHKGLPATLRRGANHVVVRYETLSGGDALFKLNWRDEYPSRLLEGTWRMHAAFDAHIARVVENWDLARIAVADRNIIRLALYEMTQVEEVPPKVAINEAIDLAKRFSTAESARFVNGILDKLFNSNLRLQLAGGPDGKTPR
jgi:transcription antitermination factor NusB